MKDIIKSQALEVNLSKTKSVDFKIPEEHLWFLALSEKYWGIHKRIQDFFTELHHPYSNRKEVIELIINVSIGDFWIYKEIDEKKKLLKFFLIFLIHYWKRNFQMIYPSIWYLSF
jgi:hypothetical protein